MALANGEVFLRRTRASLPGLLFCQKNSTWRVSFFHGKSLVPPSITGTSSAGSTGYFPVRRSFQPRKCFGSGYLSGLSMWILCRGKASWYRSLNLYRGRRWTKESLSGWTMRLWRSCGAVMRRRPFGLISLHRLALRWSMFGCWSIRGD